MILPLVALLLQVGLEGRGEGGSILFGIPGVENAVSSFRVCRIIKPTVIMKFAISATPLALTNGWAVRFVQGI